MFIAKTCILASLLYGKTSKTQDLQDLFDENDEYSQVFNYILDKLSNNQDINVSTIYSCFDIEKDSVWDKVINYQFPSQDVFDNYLKDCEYRLRINKLRKAKQAIKSKLSITTNLDEKFDCLAKLKLLDDQISKMEKEIK